MQVVAAFVPPFIWLLYFQDRASFRFSYVILSMAAVSGMAIAYGAGALESFLYRSSDIGFAWFYRLFDFWLIDGRNPQYAVADVIYGGVIEECLKFLSLLVLAAVTRSFGHPWRFVMMGIAIGCGFSFIENLSNYLPRANWYDVALWRSTTPMHVFYGAIMGALLAFWAKGRLKAVAFSTSLILPMLLHAAYNLSVSANLLSTGNAGFARFTFLALVILSLLLAVSLTRFVAEGPTKLNERNARGPRKMLYRAWGWYGLALCHAAAGIVLIILSAESAAKAGASFLLGMLILVYAILFAWHGRNCMRTSRGS